MEIRAGTSGFAYAEWKGRFYPDDLRNDGMLGFYAGRLGAVEINNTFYRMPSSKVLDGWSEQVPQSFRFVLKANRQITHFKRLKDEAIEPLEYFCSQATRLGDRLGPVLVQLPPNLPKDAVGLDGFLARVPAGVRAALEFRHDSWLDDEVFDTLRRHGAALVIAQTEESETPLVATSDFGYLRLRKAAYEDGEVAAWADRVKAQAWSEAYVFFKHEDEATGPRLAEEFLGLL